MLEIVTDHISDDLTESYVDPSLDSLHILLNIINDLIDFVNIQNEQICLDILEFNLEDVVNNSMKLFTFQAKNRNLNFTLDFDDNLPLKIKSDPNRLRQILLNLLSNYWHLINIFRYTNKGMIKIKVKQSKHYKKLIKIAVQDTGMGIDENQIKKLGKLNIEDKDKMLGGMGLTISNYLAQLLYPKTNSGLMVASEKGKGTCFTFFILNHDTTEIESENILENLVQEKNPLSNKYELFQTNYIKPSNFIPKVEESYMETSNSNCLNINIPQIKRKLSSKNLTDVSPNTPNFIEEIALSGKVGSTVLKRQNSSKSSKNSKKTSKYTNSPNKQSYISLKRADSNFNEMDRDKKYEEMITYPDKKSCKCSDILIVDDVDFNIYTLKTLCRKTNMIAEGATSGDLAIEICRNKYFEGKCCKKFKIIFMDIDMPIKNGYQTTQELVEFFKQKFIKTPIIACSAFQGEEYVNKCFECGMQDYLQKPVNLNAIEEILMKYGDFVVENN